MKALLDQVGGSHYARLKIQPIEYVLANDLGPCEANVIKYVSRFKAKGSPIGDLRKARQYLDILIEHCLENQVCDFPDREKKPTTETWHSKTGETTFVESDDPEFDYKLNKSACPLGGCDD